MVPATSTRLELGWKDSVLRKPASRPTRSVSSQRYSLSNRLWRRPSGMDGRLRSVEAPQRPVVLPANRPNGVARALIRERYLATETSTFQRRSESVPRSWTRSSSSDGEARNSASRTTGSATAACRRSLSSARSRASAASRSPPASYAARALSPSPIARARSTGNSGERSTKYPAGRGAVFGGAGDRSGATLPPAQVASRAVHERIGHGDVPHIRHAHPAPPRGPRAARARRPGPRRLPHHGARARPPGGGVAAGAPPGRAAHAPAAPSPRPLAGRSRHAGDPGILHPRVGRPGSPRRWPAAALRAPRLARGEAATRSGGARSAEGRALWRGARVARTGAPAEPRLRGAPGDAGGRPPRGGGRLQRTGRTMGPGGGLPRRRGGAHAPDAAGGPPGARPRQGRAASAVVDRRRGRRGSADRRLHRAPPRFR